MFEIITSTKFLKDLKLLKKRSQRDFQLLQDLVTVLAEAGHKGLIKSINPINLAAITKGIGNAT
jgi:mRNA interferase YafQ